MTYFQPDPVILVDSTGAPYTAGGGGATTHVSLDAGTNTIGRTQPASTIVTGTLAALNATVDGTTDLSNYATIRIQITGTFSATVTFQTSIDGTNWITQFVNPFANASFTGAVSTTTGTGMWVAEARGRYFRLNATSYTSGSAVVSILYTAAPHTGLVRLAQSGEIIGNVGFGGQTTSKQVTTNTAFTTSVKGGGGALTTVLVSNTSATTVWVKLYDKATAPTLASDTPIAVFPVVANDLRFVQFGQTGISVNNGIGLAITGASAFADTTAVAANVLVIIQFA